MLSVVATPGSAHVQQSRLDNRNPNMPIDVKRGWFLITATTFMHLCAPMAARRTAACVIAGPFASISGKEPVTSGPSTFTFGMRVACEQPLIAVTRGIRARSELGRLEYVEKHLTSSVSGRRDD